ncbi:MAG: hypothetical protein WCJ30_07205, partial [Deltaproteobacteria bacterium]
MNLKSAWLLCILVAAQGCVRMVSPDGEAPLDATDTVTPPPHDGGPDVDVTPGPVCDTPYGQVPVGGVISFDCDRCTCVAAGDLRCVPTGCADVPIQPDGGLSCPLPDGRLIPAGTSASIGCSSCYCDFGGALSCVAIPGCDGGPPPPPMDVPVSCVTPDGRAIPAGGTWSLGCRTCYCGYDGTLSCGVTPGCGDAGPPPPVNVIALAVTCCRPL